MESEASKVQCSDEGVGQTTEIACQTTPLVGEYPRIAVFLSFNLDRSIVLETKPVFTFNSPKEFATWVNTGEYLDSISNPLDLPFYYTLH